MKILILSERRVKKVLTEVINLLALRGSRHTKGVVEDPKGLKPTDCDCWWVGEASASTIELGEPCDVGFSACSCESKSVGEPERPPKLLISFLN